MQSYKYLGPPVNLGRFGNVKTGDILDLYIEEELTVQNNDEFEFVPSKKSGPKIPLRATPSFDLRSIEWNHKNLKRYLHSRRSTLKDVMTAMVEIGCDVMWLEHQSSKDAIDVMVREAIRNGWTSMSRNERMAQPMFVADSAAADEAEDADEPQDEPSADEAGADAHAATPAVPAAGKPVRKRK
jgi:hypothetical protein